jgi:uncharacterized protein (DUF58 family)
MRRAAGTSLCGLALTLIALAFDTAPLLVAGLGLTVLGAASAAWVTVAARAAVVERHVAVNRVIEGEPLRATVTVRARGPRLPVAFVEDPLAGRRIELQRNVRRSSDLIEVRFARRGRRLIPPPAVVVHDPLGLVSARQRGSGGGDELLVLPRTERVRRLAGPATDTNLHAGRAGRPELRAAVDFDGLRPYRPGTPASRIHWPALARGAGLIEKRLTPEGDHRPLVVLDTRAGEGESATEQVDAAVRAAASLVLELAARRGCGLLLPGERRPALIEPDLAAWPAAHVRLALVRGGPDVPAPALRGSPARTAAVYYVAAVAPERLPAELLEVARGVAVVVAPPSQRRPSFEVAGLHGHVVSMQPGRRVA